MPRYKSNEKRFYAITFAMKTNIPKFHFLRLNGKRLILCSNVTYFSVILDAKLSMEQQFGSVDYFLKKWKLHTKRFYGCAQCGTQSGFIRSLNVMRIFEGVSDCCFFVYTFNLLPYYLQSLRLWLNT